jgi:hypothetical protein
MFQLHNRIKVELRWATEALSYILSCCVRQRVLVNLSTFMSLHVSSFVDGAEAELFVWG